METKLHGVQCGVQSLILFFLHSIVNPDRESPFFFPFKTLFKMFLIVGAILLSLLMQLWLL